MCFNTSLVIATSCLNLTLSGFGHCSSRLSHPEKNLFLDLSKTSTTYFLKKGVHVNPTERSVKGQLHSLTYLHSIAIERILFQYSLLHPKDEPKFRRNFMFNNQPLKKNNSICIHCFLLHFLICVFRRGKVLHLLKYVVTIDSSGQNLSVFLYKKVWGDSIMQRRLRVKQKTTKFSQFKIPHYYEKWLRAGRVSYSVVGETGEIKMAPKYWLTTTGSFPASAW